METAELDVALEELETRLERLRALYEQYFMGIERIEPAIPRKDVDRRIYVLRREKIRNTAKRFKLQTIIQRYNTFQQYWQRICREIENGTYKRHVIRAARVAPEGLLTIAARKRLGRNRAGSEAPPPDPEGFQDEAVTALTAQPFPSTSSSAPPVRSAPPMAASQTPPARTQPPRTPSQKPLESLSLDMDFLGDWDPGAQALKQTRGKPAKPALAAPAAPRAPAPASPAAAPPPPEAVAAPPPAAPATTSLLQRAPLKPPPKPAARMAQPAPAPVPVKPPQPKPAEKAAPAQPAAVAPAAGPRTLAEEQVRSLHARLVEAKRQTKDASSVSVEGLARSLEATAAKLREQHKNRKIDFDVVIKDGKAVVKPIVR